MANRDLLPVPGPPHGRDLPAVLLAQAVAGWAAYNREQLGQREDTIEWLSYLGGPTPVKADVQPLPGG
jgi:hypothetical protein